MKIALLLALTAAAAPALSLPNDNHQAPLNGGNAGDVERFLLELSPGETLWGTEEEKWALRRVCVTKPSLAEDSDVINACGLSERNQLYGHHRYP